MGIRSFAAELLPSALQGRILAIAQARGLSLTAEDLIFVADAFNRRVQVFRYVGEGS